MEQQEPLFVRRISNAGSQQQEEAAPLWDSTSRRMSTASLMTNPATSKGILHFLFELR